MGDSRYEGVRVGDPPSRSRRQMRTLKQLATAGTATVMGLGLGVASASAYTIDGIGGNPFNYTGTPTAQHQFSFSGVNTITCPMATTSFSGTATGSVTTSFTPYYGANDPSVPAQAPPFDTGYNCEWYGFPVRVAQIGPWSLAVVNLKGGSPEVHGVAITIPSSSTTTIEMPIIDCRVVVSGPQAFVDGVGGDVVQATDTGTGVDLDVVVAGIGLSSVGSVSGGPSGCPFTTADTAEYNPNGPISIPGIEIN